MDTVLVISRAPFSTFTTNGRLFKDLQDKNLIFLLSEEVRDRPTCDFLELHFMDLTDTSGDLDSLIDALCHRHDIKHIVNISEQDVLPAACARSRHGLSGLQADNAEPFRNKLLMKEIAVSAGLRVAEFANAVDRPATSHLLGRARRVVAKPIYGYGSSNTFVVSDPGHLNELYAKHGDYLHYYMAEEYIEGDVYHLDCLVRDGTSVFSTLGRYDVPLIRHAEVEWMATRLTNKATPLHLKALSNLMAFLKKVGLRDGVFHFEFFNTVDGLVFLEVAARPSGGEVCDAIFNTWGVNLFEEAVKLQLELPTSVGVLPLRYAAVAWRMSPTEGVITRLDGIDPGLSRQVSVRPHCLLGDKVNVSRHCADSLITFLLTSSRESGIESLVKKLHASVRITIEAFPVQT